MKKKVTLKSGNIMGCNISNQLIYAFLFFVFFSSNNFSQNIQKNNGEYKLIWEDNFENKNGLTQNWNVIENGDGGGNKELQFYGSQNITYGKEPVSGDNCLIITARKENYNNKLCTSGQISTQGKMSFKYGKLEARIKMPATANGLWPAFWLLGIDNTKFNWPKCGEIDVVEMGKKTGIINGVQDRYFNGGMPLG